MALSGCLLEDSDRGGAEAEGGIHWGDGVQV